MKKVLLIIAFTLYLAGLAVIADWIVFCERNSDLQHDFGILKTKYIERFPEALQSFFSLNPQPAALFFAFGFVLAGIIFMKQNKKPYTVLAITSFIFGVWNLFSIM